jgi:hypothetical protein
MTWPLLALAVFAVIGGFIGISENYGSQFIAVTRTHFPFAAKNG